MSKREQLNLYIRQVQQRLRLDAGLRGAAVIAFVALAATVILTLILNAYAYDTTWRKGKTAAIKQVPGLCTVSGYVYEIQNGTDNLVSGVIDGDPYVGDLRGGRRAAITGSPELAIARDCRDDSVWSYLAHSRAAVLANVHVIHTIDG